MFATTINGKNIQIRFLNKLSFNTFIENIELFIDGIKYPLTKDDLLFDCKEMHEEEEGLYIGNFDLSNGLIFSTEDSLKLQQMYIDWENETLSRKLVRYKLPISRDDQNSGIPSYNPYFHALMSNAARQSPNLGPIQLGVFFEQKELKFAQQYIAFHPELHRYLKLKENSNTHHSAFSVDKDVAEFMCKHACLHIEGYRDGLRYQRVSDSNGFTSNDNDKIKYLPEYEHVLDSPFMIEKMNFHRKSAKGGLLEMFEAPFN